MRGAPLKLISSILLTLNESTIVHVYTCMYVCATVTVNLD